MIGHVLANGFMLVGDVVYRLQLVTDAGSFFEVELLGRAQHFMHQAFLHALSLAAKHVH